MILYGKGSICVGKAFRIFEVNDIRLVARYQDMEYETDRDVLVKGICKFVAGHNELDTILDCFYELLLLSCPAALSIV